MEKANDVLKIESLQVMYATIIKSSKQKLEKNGFKFSYLGQNDGKFGKAYYYWEYYKYECGYLLDFIHEWAKFEKNRLLVKHRFSEKELQKCFLVVAKVKYKDVKIIDFDSIEVKQIYDLIKNNKEILITLKDKNTEKSIYSSIVRMANSILKGNTEL